MASKLRRDLLIDAADTAIETSITTLTTMFGEPDRTSRNEALRVLVRRTMKKLVNNQFKDRGAGITPHGG